MKKRFLSLAMALCMAVALMVPAWADNSEWSDALSGVSGAGSEKLYLYMVLNSATNAKKNVVTSEDGNDVYTWQVWVTPAEMETFQQKIDATLTYYQYWDSLTTQQKNVASATTLDLQNAINTFKNAQKNGYKSDAGTVTDPGTGDAGNTGSAPVALPFPDVAEDAWYYDFVCQVYEKGLFAGFEDGTFGPDREMTLNQFCAVLYQFSGETGTVSDFSYYMTWAKDAGLLPQTVQDTVDPTDSITRQDMAAIFGAFLTKYNVSYTPVNTTAASYTDQADIDSYAAGGVAICWQAGIMAGRDNGSFGPNDTAKRCEVAVTMVQMARVMGQ